MREPFVGEIREFVGETAPAGWALCDGRVLQINDHRTLFALLGSQFGGDGRWTFALPALTGSRSPAAGNKVARNRREDDRSAAHGTDRPPGGTRFIISLDGSSPRQ
ncbi:phage tail protein [Nakamurella lactea]|uniref:phage tail protein n=1 Tax=Nakamurella lactea TaxID=459515 RepID=UPI0009FE4B12|nr:tail fiber protein [Nakamurella lactea]